MAETEAREAPLPPPSPLQASDPGSLDREGGHARPRSQRAGCTLVQELRTATEAGVGLGSQLRR